ncbi:MAG TPA: DegT/DnrJ/EryC1/StrS family aminotransferase [Mycobacteriales bacterium]|nr:DegT/DnrJ/EryC1/StrS family aminotransferase [Mycobacteriales bacterium]
MPSANVAARVSNYARDQALRVGRGEKPVQGLVNRTVGLDDVVLAQRLLRELDEHDNPAPVHSYEEDFRRLLGAGPYVTAWSSARVALSAGLKALRLQPGDDVLLPGYTCVVVANALRYAEINPIFVDIELDTFGPSIESIRERLTPDTKAILVQHLYGLVARDYGDIQTLCQERGIRLIDDCSHAAGAQFLGGMVGTTADLAIYSSEQSKVYSTIQGGVATTRDPEVYQRLHFEWHSAKPSGRGFTERLLRNVQLAYLESANPLRAFTGPVGRRLWNQHRLTSTPPEEEMGCKPLHYGRRMSAPVARIGSNQLRKLASNNAKRRAAAERWRGWADEHGYATPLVVDGSEPVFLRYPVLVPAAMKQDTSWGRDLGVEVGIWFASQLHPVPGEIESCPNAQHAVEHCVNLPTL